MSFAQCNDIKIYYEIHGEGESLLLINGLGGDVRSLSPLVSHLKTSFKVISFDLRGAGKSDKPEKAYSIHQMADDAKLLLHQLKIEKTHLLGFSMGGCIALDLAVNSPEIINSLYLVSTLPAWKGRYPVTEKIAQLFRRTDISRDLLHEVYEKVFGPKFKSKISFDEYYRARMIDPMPQPEDAYLNQLDALERFDVEDRVAEISLPATIVAGDCDEVVPIENSKWMHENIKNSKFHILEGIGHTITLEAPKELAEIV